MIQRSRDFSFFRGKKYYPVLLQYINCLAVPAPKENVLFSRVTEER